MNAKLLRIMFALILLTITDSAHAKINRKLHVPLFTSQVRHYKRLNREVINIVKIYNKLRYSPHDSALQHDYFTTVRLIKTSTERTPLPAEG